MVTPIFQSSTFEYHGEGYHDVGYVRLSNTPNHRVLVERYAAMNGAEAALCFSSGMAATTTLLMGLLSAGDHLLVQRGLYGGTTGLLARELTRFGITYSVIDPQKPADWKRHLTRKSRMLFSETLSNPLVQVPDLEAMIDFARAHRLVSVNDNTFASPVNYLPIAAGFDLVLESGTKYLAGHDDVAAGCVAGRREHISRIKDTLDHLGGVLDPHACFLLERGLKTLTLRVAYQNASATRVAQFLLAHPRVRSVNHPSLPIHPQHERAARLLAGPGGLLSFELRGSVAETERTLRKLRLPVVAGSLGGVNSLIVRPAAATHSGMSRAARTREGISEGLVRFSIGLESTDDLIDDLSQALATR